MYIYIYIYVSIRIYIYSSVDAYYMDYLGSLNFVFCTSVLRTIPLVLTLLYGKCPLILAGFRR